MIRLTSHEVVLLLLALGIILALARLLGELAVRFNQPSVLGELLAGILLGPTILGRLAPSIHSALFPAEGGMSVAFNALTTIAVVLFLLVAGLEVNLSSIWRQGGPALAVSISGILVPFGLGFALAWVAPAMMDFPSQTDRTVFALFLATALSISALPVIAKTLMDLNLYRSDMGMIIIASAIFNDLIGWIIFAVILGMIGGGGEHRFSIQATTVLTLSYAGLMLTVGRRAIDRFLPWLTAHTTWPAGILSFSVGMALLGAAFTEWIGVHAIFGSFIMGIAIGDSPHLREQTRTTIGHFISFIFAPLFFASIGLRVNFLAHFDPALCGVILVIACLGKVVGCGLGARLGGIGWREAWAIGFGMNARGAMEIILGLLALQYRLIDERMFVALVVMAIATSLMAGPAVRRILQLKRRRRFTDFVPTGAYIPALRATDSESAIRELCKAICDAGNLDHAAVQQAVLERERLMSTGMGRGLAVPHARLPGLAAPVVGLGVSHGGVDFNARDGQPANFICLILTPREDDGAQLEILADVARSFQHEAIRAAMSQAANHTAFRAAMNMRAE